MKDHFFIGHHHVQLPCVHYQKTEYLQPLLHDLHRLVFKTCPQDILVNIHVESPVIENLLYQTHPPVFTRIVGRTPFETKVDIVFRYTFAHITLHACEMEPETGVQAAIMFGDHEIVSFCIGGAHTGHKRGVLGCLEHNGHQAFTVNRRGAFPGDHGYTLPKGPHRYGYDIVDVNTCPYDFLFESIVKIQYPPLHGNLTHKLLCGVAGKRVLSTETKHLPDCIFMAIPDYIMICCAVFRPEIRGVRVSQRKRQNMIRDLFQYLMYRSIGHHRFALSRRFDELGDFSIIDARAGPIHGHPLAIRQFVAGVFHPEDRRSIELPGHTGQMTGNTPVLGYNGGTRAHQYRPFGQRVHNHHHCVLRKTQDISVLFQDIYRARRDTGADPLPSLE